MQCLITVKVQHLALKIDVIAKEQACTTQNCQFLICTEGREGLEARLIISLCLGMMLSSVMFAYFLLDRYPYYALSVINYEVKQLTWLRYTAWIPLYPLGFTCEGQL